MKRMKSFKDFIKETEETDSEKKERIRLLREKKLDRILKRSKIEEKLNIIKVNLI